MYGKNYARDDFSLEDIEQELDLFENAIREVSKASKSKKCTKKLKKLKEIYN